MKIVDNDVQATPSFNPFESQCKKRVIIPGVEIPSFRVQEAFDRGVANNYLINTWGGLGDQICAEPAIRYALKVFKNQEISLASRCPSLFAHLKFKDVFDTRVAQPDWDKYLTFQTILPPSSLLWEFCTHMISHCVDFPSICMWRSTLPNADKEIILPNFETENKYVKQVIALGDKAVVIHAGKHWQSKTFPKAWWDKVILSFIDEGFIPVLIGHNVDKNVGYVDVDPTGCIDTRDKLDIKDFIALLKNCKFLFSNDSSPIHAASAGNAYIGVVASCKHPDYILHWRHGQFSWNAKNYGKDGVWNHINFAPAQEEEVKVEELPSGLMEALLPCPKEVAADFAFQRTLQPHILGGL